jgi:hypothetical protein
MMWMTHHVGIFQYCGWIFTVNDQLWYNCVSACRNGATAIMGHTEYGKHHTACEVRTLHDSPWISCGNLRLKQTKFWKTQHWIFIKANIISNFLHWNGLTIWPLFKRHRQFSKRAVNLMSVRVSTWDNSAHSGRIFVKFCIDDIY